MVQMIGQAGRGGGGVVGWGGSWLCLGGWREGGEGGLQRAGGAW